MSFRFKVCGITEQQGLAAAVEAGADALGFNFHPGSPRFIQPERARELIGKLSRPVATVGVFVNREPSVVLEWMQRSGVGWAQFHGDETPEQLQDFPRPWFPAVRVEVGTDPDVTAWAAPFVLIDARQHGAYGGTGRTADWWTAAGLARQVPVLLAGGLCPSNLPSALETVQPAGVDLNSGVESGPGLKDPELLRQAGRILTSWWESTGATR